MKLLLWLLCLGDPTNGGGEIHGIHFPRLQTPLMQLVFALLLVGAVAMVWWFYRREASYVPTSRKRLLSGLRVGAWIVILFILTGAFLEVTRAEDSKGSLLVLIDASQSMGIADRRTEPADIASAVKILGEDHRADVDKATRTDLVKAAFASKQLDPLRVLKDRFKVEAYTFGKTAAVTPFELTPIEAGGGGALDKLGAPMDNATQLGAALLDAARRSKGRKLDGIVVISDGGSNRGDDPVEAAKAIGAPIYTVGVGLPQAKDLEIPFLFCEDVVFKNDRFQLNVRIKQRGYSGRQATLVIKRIDEQKNEEVVKEEQVDLNDDLERMRAVEVLPDKEGVFTYVAELTAFPDEADMQNNRRAKVGVKVVDKKIRVLMIEDSPRYVYRFVKSILEADRQRIAPTFILRQGDSGGRGAKTMRQFPTAAELRNFDVIVLGDIAPDFFSDDEFKALEEFVRKEGGGLLAIAGSNHMPGQYQNSPLAAMLPVEVDTMAAPTVEDELSHTIKNGFRPVVTPEGSRWPPLRFSPDAGENELQWRQADQLFWFYPSRKVKSGATTLLAHPDRTVGDAKMPILASQRYGKGQVVYFASDEAWRWRYHPGAAQHRRLWGQMVSSLAMAHLLGSSDRAQVETDRSEYAVGDHAQIIARLLDSGFNPVAADSVTATVERELSRDTVTLGARKDQPGVFSGEWVPSDEGRWRISVESGGETADRVVSVVNPRIEFEDIGQRQELLTRMAQASGGAYLPLENIQELAKALTAKEKSSNQRRAERTLWNAPGVMILLTLFLGSEWFLRKRSDLL